MNEGLADAFDRLSQAWREASEGWDDAQRTRFEAEYLEPILAGTRRYLDALAALDHALRETGADG